MVLYWFASLSPDQLEEVKKLHGVSSPSREPNAQYLPELILSVDKVESIEKEELFSDQIDLFPPKDEPWSDDESQETSAADKPEGI